MENQTRTIVKYSNRKLYDKTDSKYTTIKAITQFLKSGEKIMVIDNVTKMDITKQTLLSVLVENELSQSDTTEVEISNILKAGGLTQYIKGLKNE